MLIDEVTITIKGGDGGNGAVSFRTNEGNYRGGPDGGNGGNGGSVYLQGVDDVSALQKFQYKKKWEAETGIKGNRKNLYGRNGVDLIISIPFGTHVTDLESGKTREMRVNDERVLMAAGGKGGRGNNEFKSSTNQTPRFAEKGTLGEEKKIRLVLRIIADIGIIGLPNAGKSSLLSVLTNAQPKIGDYPFTTLEPNLGVMDKYILADIPGLIEGASKGKGLGISFLKHIEKTKMLIHCIDGTVDNVVETYNTVRNEFSEYNTKLLDKNEILLLTKSDLLTKEETGKKVKQLKKMNKKVYSINIYDDSEIKKLVPILLKELKTI